MVAGYAAGFCAHTGREEKFLSNFLKRWYPDVRIYSREGGETVEEQWIREIQRSGSRAAAEALIRARYDEIYRFVYRQTGHKEDAMDLTQSIFLAMLRALPTYRAERGTFRTWLYRIAANKVIDARRRARLVPLPLDEMEVSSEEDFTVRMQNQALLEQIEGFVSGLEPQVQAVFRLRLYAEQSFPEIAAALGEPEAAVKSRYYRLLGRLREEFDPHG